VVMPSRWIATASCGKGGQARRGKALFAGFSAISCEPVTFFDGLYTNVVTNQAGLFYTLFRDPISFSSRSVVR
jgi:hypothetical protein